VDPSENSYDTAIHKVSESVMRHLRTAGIRLAAERRHVLHEGAPRFAADYHQIEDRLDLLEGLALFGGMQRESLRDLANSMELRRFRAGEDYFHEGDNSTQMFILLEGSLLVTLEKGDQHIELTSLQPGDYFGEMALLTGEPRSATVRSYTDSLSFEISRDAMKQLVEDHAEVLKLMSRNLAARKLANDASIRTALAEEENSNDSLASILFTKMKELFSLTNRPWGSRPSIPKTGVEGGQE
jgi:CRP-like cAMP-binding protein